MSVIKDVSGERALLWGIMALIVVFITGSLVPLLIVIMVLWGLHTITDGLP